MIGDMQHYHLPGFDEPVNSISHLLAAVVFAVLGVLLVRRGRGCSVRVSFLVVYAVACVLMMSMSAVLHMMRTGTTAEAVMDRIDHGAIFILIAGTFTAVHGVIFRGWFRWVPLICVWCIALASLTVKTVFFESLPQSVGLTMYLLLGWGVSLTAIPILRRHGVRYVTPLFYGGAAYSIGAILYANGWFTLIPGVVGSHEMWHIAVLIGAFSHWWFVWRAVGDQTATQPAVGSNASVPIAA